MSRVIVISVGTSLLTNNLGVEDQKLGTFAEQVIKSLESVSVTDLLKMEFKFDGHSLSSIDNCPNLIGLEDFARAFFNKYLKKDEILKNIKNRESGADRLPAEISSLYLYYYYYNQEEKKGILREEFIRETGTRNREKDRIILLTTDTPDAVYCTKVVKELINRTAIFQGLCCVKDEDLVIIENLDVYEPEKWVRGTPSENTSNTNRAQSGMNNLFDYFHTEFNSSDAGKVLIRTGGYKEFSSLLFFLAVQFRFESLYLFERSYNFVRLFIKSISEDFDVITLLKQHTEIL